MDEVKFAAPEAGSEPITEVTTPVTEVVEPIVTEQVATPVTPEPIVENKTTVDNDYLKRIKDVTGREFKDENEIKSFFEEHEKIKTEFSNIKERDDYYAELENEIIEKGKDYDPVAKFGGKENYKKAMIIQELSKNGDEGIAKKFVMGDRGKMDSIETLSLFAQYNDSSLVGDSETAKRTALRQLGIRIEKDENIDEAIENLDKEDKSIINMRAKEIKGLIDKAIENVPEPEIKDPVKDIFNKVESKKAKIQEVSAKWDTAKTQILDSIDHIEFKNTDFKFQIDKEDVAGVVESFLKGAAMQGIEPDEAGRNRVVQAIKNSIWDKNRDKILEARDSYNESKWKEAYDKKHTNAAPLTVNTPSPVGGNNGYFIPKNM
jgi:hypothetical protein